MGQVWLAEQKEPVRRRVALKLIKSGFYDELALRRFQSERQSLAIMDHPSIAKVFDAGATAEGQPYFAMEYVPGVAITKYCDDKKFRIRDRLELFVRVCEGVQHAHQKAIIHRDLKPANILVVEVDGKSDASHYRLRAGKGGHSDRDGRVAEHPGRKFCGNARLHEPRAGGSGHGGYRYPHRCVFARRRVVRIADGISSVRCCAVGQIAIGRNASAVAGRRSAAAEHQGQHSWRCGEHQRTSERHGALSS